jgi:hypothetical protein
MNPELFMTTVNLALANQLPGNTTNAVLRYSLESVDTNRPSMLHFGRSYWYSTVGPFTIQIPDANEDATAATWGHYTNVTDNSSPNGTAVVDKNLVATADGSSWICFGNGPCAIQWPMTYTVFEYQQPGSADVDGLVTIGSGTNSDPANVVPLLTFNASNYAYNLYGTSTVGSAGSIVIVHNSNAQIPATVGIMSDGSGIPGNIYSSSDVTLTEFTIANTPDWASVCTSIGTNTVVLRLYNSNGTYVSSSAQPLSYFWDNIGLGSQSTFKTTLGPCTFQPSTIQPSGIEPVPVRIQLLQSTTVLCEMNATVLFSSTTTKSFRANASSTDPTIQKVTSLFTSMGPLAIDGWAGGGGSMLDQTPITYGGASGHVAVTVQPLLVPIKRIDIFVGQSGIRDSFSRCTGGSHTSVVINGMTVFDIGGGGGSALGSHGGAGGAPRDAIVDLNEEHFLMYSGYSGSTQPFTTEASGPLENGPPYTPQALGPHGKPGYGPSGASGGQLEEIFQGSGSGFENNEALPGDAGFYFSGSTKILGSEGGTGATGGQGGPAGTGGRQSTNYLGLIGPYGGGGGSSTQVLNTSKVDTVYGSFELQVNCVNPPIIFKAGPLGGGYTNDPLQLQESNCSPTSIMSVIVKNVWTITQQNAWTTQVLQGLATVVADGFMANPDSNQNFMYPTDDAFVNPSVFDNTDTVVSYVPLGPHDTFLPGSNAPNVRPVSPFLPPGNTIIWAPTEQALYNDNTVLCIRNDGQVDPESVAYSLNTVFTGPGVLPNTLVIDIQFGPSKPQGLYNSIYLTFNNALGSAAGPFTWYIQSSSALCVFWSPSLLPL